jgi:hypothetical protein
LEGSTGQQRGEMGGVVKSPPRRLRGRSMSEKSLGITRETMNLGPCEVGCGIAETGG